MCVVGRVEGSGRKPGWGYKERRGRRGRRERGWVVDLMVMVVAAT